MKIASFKVSSIHPVVGRWVFYSPKTDGGDSSFLSVVKGIAELSIQFVSQGTTSFQSDDFDLKTRVINEGKYAFVVDVYSIKH